MKIYQPKHHDFQFYLTSIFFTEIIPG